MTDKPKTEFYKFPGLMETCNFRKTSAEFVWGIVTPQKYYESHVKAAMSHLSRVGVFFFVPCSSIEQVEALIAQDIDAPVDGALPVPEGGELALDPVDVGTLAEWLCMTERNVQILEGKGIVRKAGRGQYELKASVMGYIHEINRQGDGKNSDYHKERTEKIRIQRLEIERQHLEAMGKLVNYEEVRRAQEKRDAMMKQKMRFLPKSLPPMLAGLSAAEQEPVIGDAIDKLLVDFSAVEVSGDGGGGGGPDHATAAETDRKPVGGRKKKARRKNKRRAG